MPNQETPQKICPHLGLAADPGSHFSYPESAHFCFAADKPTSIEIDHQHEFCFGKYPACARFVNLVDQPAAKTSHLTSPPQAKNRQSLIWGALALVLGVLVLLGVYFFNAPADSDSPLPADTSDVQIVLNPTATVTPTPKPATTTPTPEARVFLATPTPTSTTEPGIEIFSLSPLASAVGWVASNSDRGNNFGDSYLYAGNYEGQVYQSAMQFDLSTIPRGAPIYAVSLSMTGLRDDRLAKNLDRTDISGSWIVRMLDSEIDLNWRRHSYQDIFNAPVIQTLNPILSDEDLAVGKENIFELTSAQIAVLEQRIIDNQIPTISFRVEGPLVGPDNLFAWDTGYGVQTQGNPVTLNIKVGEPPATPPPYDYIVVTSTPTPENVVTAAALSMQMTAEATRIGTATPAPANVVTATPVPDLLVIIPTSTPENEITAQAIVAIGTAQALTTGTPTPLPTNAVTATPIPTITPTPFPTQPVYILITSTPTPETVFAAATMSARATAQVLQFGEPTPLPVSWVTPVVVTATPTPMNAATVQAQNALATAIAVTTGTPTATPSNVVTATPTPVYETIPFLLTPTTPVPPTPTPQTIPPVLVGKILFKSDREGSDTETFYVYDPETGELGRLADRWPYDAALARDAWSTDKRFRVFTKDALQYGNIPAPALYTYDYLYNFEQQLTNFGAGIAYGGAWSPTSDTIAFTSNDSSDDEIWIVDYDGENLKQLTDSNVEYNAQEIGKDTFFAELSKFPSWSPDGSQIVFMSNRTGTQQLWIMNADGSDQRLLMGWDRWTSYNDTEPVWVKYPDTAPPQ